ncbi:uncharacterized protein LOC130727680 [Lotus japonicus]|uniref:uncharacterized protein LOC130727680 n=1 Tax=Lotus japonicus TaxID=34305 RepID=UPI0025877067|nr:uncharacterized protein LOC130727680 [Lotus japonicus]
MATGKKGVSKKTPRRPKKKTPTKETVVPETVVPEKMVPEKTPFSKLDFWLNGDLPANYVSRPTAPHKITMSVYHGGELTFDPTMPYPSGLCEVWHPYDVDLISSIELGKIVKYLGYARFKCLWYRHVQSDGSVSFSPLSNDEEVRQFIEDVKDIAEVDLYVEHIVEEADIVPLIAYKSAEDTPDVLQVDSDSDDEDYSEGWRPNWNGDTVHGLFEVERDKDKYAVNVALRSCACRRWDLTGIPCVHAVACMWYNHHVPENYVDMAYRRHTFLNTYSHIILPNNGPKLWPEVEAAPLNPPYVRRAPGRPKKQRNKANDEPRNPNRLRRISSTVRCRRCGEPGHNKRTCKGKTAADRTIPVGGNQANTQVLQPEQRRTQGTGTRTRGQRRNAQSEPGESSAQGAANYQPAPTPPANFQSQQTAAPSSQPQHIATAYSQPAPTATTSQPNAPRRRGRKRNAEAISGTQ